MQGTVRARVTSVIGIGSFEVVVCGGGVAGVEALLRLRRLGGDRMRLTLVSPDRDLVYRPLAVLEPFAPSGVPRYPLERITADVGARWVRDGLSSVDHASRAVHTYGGATLRYDALLLAIVGGGPTADKPDISLVDYTLDNTVSTYHEPARCRCFTRAVMGGAQKAEVATPAIDRGAEIRC